MERKHTSRRDLLHFGVAAAATSVCGGCALFGSRKPDAVVEAEQGMLRLSEADSSKLLGSEGSLLVEPKEGDGKILLVHLNDGSLYAVSAVCTHMGCNVLYDPDLGLIRCPCHGSQYGLDGQNTKGPAKRPLKAYAVRTQGGRVVITL